ncbi:MAG: caspase family protein [Pseudomonadota bacterium]
MANIAFRIAVLATLIAFALPSHASRVALVIGVADYQHFQTLRNPVRDANLLQRVFKNDLQFDQVIKLENPDRASMAKAIALFAEQAQGADVAVIYFSGHGMQNSQRRNFLIPRDVKVDGDADLKANAIVADELVDAVSGATVKLVILDACRDSPTGRKSASKGLARMSGEGNGLLIAYATEEGRTAEDGAGLNSPYALALAENLRQTDKSILAQFDGVARAVRKAVPWQNPQRYGNLEIDVFLVAVPGGGAARAQVGPSEPGFSIADIKQEKEARAKWSVWQTHMRSAFEEVVALDTTPEYRIALWDRFLLSYAQDNPYTSDDDALRAEARTRQTLMTQHLPLQVAASIGLWTRPAKGGTESTYSETGKGIDYFGSVGDAVLAAAKGVVVYAGAGIRGYGHLVVLRHSGDLMSVYANNRKLLVKEGQPVAPGEQLAEMGDTDADRPKLHFEVRLLGKAVDPAPYFSGRAAVPDGGQRFAGEAAYTVKKGDTLAKIALDHGQNYHDLITWNNLANQNDIHVGDVLRVRLPAQ